LVRLYSTKNLKLERAADSGNDLPSAMLPISK